MSGPAYTRYYTYTTSHNLCMPKWSWVAQHIQGTIHTLLLITYACLNGHEWTSDQHIQGNLHTLIGLGEVSYDFIGIYKVSWRCLYQSLKGFISHGRCTSAMGGVHQPWKGCISHGRGSSPKGGVHPHWSGASPMGGCIDLEGVHCPWEGCITHGSGALAMGGVLYTWEQYKKVR